MHSYTQNDIEKVIKNALTSGVKSLEKNGDWSWIVKFYSDTTMNDVSDQLEDLHDSDLFDVQFKAPDTYEIEFKSSVLEFHQWKIIRNRLNEFSSEKMTFDDAQIKMMTILYNFQNSKYHQGFFKSIHDQLVKDKSLTKKQYEQFKFLLDNGKSMYEAGKLSTKN